MGGARGVEESSRRRASGVEAAEEELCWFKLGGREDLYTKGLVYVARIETKHNPGIM